MRLKRDWESYPATYRAGEMQTIANWIQAGESGSLVGLPGAGKSNLLGFLSHRPEALRQYLPPDFPKLALIHVDLNNLPTIDLSTFFRVILRAMNEARAQLADLDASVASEVELLYRKVEDKTDPFLAQSALRDALLLFREQAIRVVLVLDPFDQFCKAASTQVLDNLRGLRDGFKTTLSYLFGLRQEIAYLRSPEELGELYEIIDTHVCWVGAMDRDDARWVISQVEASTRRTFEQVHVDQIMALAGGFPALLRVTSLWLFRQKTIPMMDTWLERLLATKSIVNRLFDLRQGLTGEEELALSELQKVIALSSPKMRRESLRQIGEKYQPTLTRLEDKTLCRRTETGLELFSPIFAGYVAQMKGVSRGKIRYESATDHFFRGETDLTELSEKDRRLLRHFLDNPYAVQSLDDLIEAAWPEDYSSGVSNEAVQQAIRHLRQQIEPNPAKPCYLMTERGAGYRFFPEGAPRG